MIRRRSTLLARSGVAAGFTLVEVLIALAILTIIGAISFMAIGNAIEVRDWLAREDEVDRSARVALTRVTRELSLAFLTEQTQAVNSYRTVFVGTDGSDADSVWFSTMSHHRTLRDSRECDQSEVTLWTQEDSDSGGLVLLHRESPRIDQEPDEGGAVLPLATGVKRFELRYLDPVTNEWRDDWDTTGIDTTNRLPRAIEVLLVLIAPDPDDEDSTLDRPYLTTVLVERADRLTRSLLQGGSG